MTNVAVNVEDYNGTPAIGNRHIPLWRIARWHDDLGWELDDIATECGLTLDEVNAALAYFRDNREACAPPVQTSN